MIREKFSKAWNNSLARNAGWMFMGQGMSVVIQGVYFIVLARLLDSFQYGVYVGAAALVGIVGQYSTLGSGMVFLRYVSADHKKFAPYWGNVIMSTFGMGGLLIIGLHFEGHRFVGADSAAIVTFVAVSECICARLAESTGQIFQTFEKLRITATLSMVVSAFRLMFAVGMLLVLHKANAHQWVIASLAVSLVGTTIAVALVTYHYGPPKFDLGLFRKSIGEGFGFAVAYSTTSIYNDIDKTMLSKYGFTEATGIYAMAYRVIDISTLPIRSIHSAAMPRFFRKGFDGVEHTVEFAKKILKKTSLFGIGASVVMFATAPLIPHIIGKSFARSTFALQWLCLLPLLRSCHLSAGDAISGAGYQNFRTASQFVAAGFNFGVNLYLIPRYSWRGAAWSSLATDGGLAIMNWTVLLYLNRRDKRKRNAILPPLVPAA